MATPARSSTPGRLAALLAVTAALLGGLPAVVGTAAATTVRHVAPTGSDSAPGTAAAPFRTLGKALTMLEPGDTLLVRGGTYPERVRPRIRPGTAEAPVHVRAHPGERPVVQGLLWLSNPSFWHLSGINVTWGATNTSSEHMVKLTGGTGWSFTDAEVWGARSYAAVLVAGSPSDWRLADNHIHDTHPSNGTNQDHLVYANAGTAGGGVIEGNVLATSPNGRAVKIGPPAATSGAVAGITIRYNTMVDNRGPSNVQLAWQSSGTRVSRNIMVRPAAGRSAVTAHQLTGTGNVVSDNLVFDAARATDVTAGLTGSGNLTADPGFVDPAAGDFRTTNPVAAAYGAAALRRTAQAPAPRLVTADTRREVSIGIRQAAGVHTVSGALAPARAGVQVTLARLDAVSGRVTGVASTRTVAGGRYELRTRLPAGRAGYYALTPGTPDGPPARSRLYGLVVPRRGV